MSKKLTTIHGGSQDKEKQYWTGIKQGEITERLCLSV